MKIAVASGPIPVPLTGKLQVSAATANAQDDIAVSRVQVTCGSNVSCSSHVATGVHIERCSDVTVVGGQPSREGTIPGSVHRKQRDGGLVEAQRAIHPVPG